MRVSPALAAALSLFVPGLGQDALGLRLRGAAWCAAAVVPTLVFSRPGAPVWGLVLPAALWLAGAWDAWRLARGRQKPRVR
jgi:hypothetical protein